MAQLYEHGDVHVMLFTPSSRSLSSTWAASSEFGTYRLCEQRRFRRACASAQSRQNLHCSLIQAGSQEEPSDRLSRSLAPLNSWACAVKICHDGMLEDINSLHEAHFIFETTQNELIDAKGPEHEPRQANCVFEHSVMTNFNCACPVIQRGQGCGFLSEGLKVPLDSLLVWASSEGSGETARMRRLAWTFAARSDDKYQIRLTRTRA